MKSNKRDWSLPSNELHSHYSDDEVPNKVSWHSRGFQIIQGQPYVGPGDQDLMKKHYSSKSKVGMAIGASDDGSTHKYCTVCGIKYERSKSITYAQWARRGKCDDCRTKKAKASNTRFCMWCRQEYSKRPNESSADWGGRTTCNKCVGNRPKQE